MQLFKDVLGSIKPDEKEIKEVNEKIYNFISKLNKNLREGKAILGGSGAKGTWLSKAHDADVFVQFNYQKYKDKSDRLSDILEKILKKTFSKVKRIHGSRDYFQIKQKSFNFEIVPILKISKAKDAVNITDVSPLHADWVNKFKFLSDEIRLMKQFCKAAEVYGAESYIMGFSGYMCELLIINYGGFLKTVKAVSKWKPKTIIDPAKHYKNKNDVLFNINNSKLAGPLVIVDPVQKDRNAASALSYEKYNKFIGACKKFLKNPCTDFFKIKEVDENELSRRASGKKLILLDIDTLSGKQDIVGSKLLKVVEFIYKNLKEKEFNVYEYGWKWDKEKTAMIWFIVDKKELRPYVINRGPPISNKFHVKKFEKKHKKTFVKGRFVFAEDKREFRDALKLVKKLIKEKYVKDKVKRISVKQ